MKTTRRAVLGQLSVCGLLGRALPVEYEGRPDGIAVLRGERLIQRVASANPSFVEVDHTRHRLFAVNEIDEYEGLPTGSVESYAIEASGMIQLISRRPLALSAIRPKHLAISPDGRYLVVAVYGGGAYNVLAIEADGRIGRLTHVWKKIGSRPRSVVFDRSGRFVIAGDSIFAFNNGRLTPLSPRALS